MKRRESGTEAKAVAVSPLAFVPHIAYSPNQTEGIEIGMRRHREAYGARREAIHQKVATYMSIPANGKRSRSGWTGIGTRHSTREEW
jgi:hypothetical protein